jgi:DNA-binding response OmpR family regulator
MIVDDDRTTVGLLQTLLELDGFSVTLAPDGAAAKEQALRVKPDAFLVDFNLSDCEGTDFVRWVREQQAFASTPIVMASGMERSEMARVAGANHFLIKPFDPTDLVNILNKLIGQ